MKSILPIVGLGLALCQSAFTQSPPAASPAGTLRLSLDDALARARANSPQILQANIATLLAREDTVQAKAGMLPQAGLFNQFIYTQPNGSPSGVFVSADGTHIYNNQAAVHGDIYSPEKMAEYHRLQVAEAVAHARADIAARGLRGHRGGELLCHGVGRAQGGQLAAEPRRGQPVPGHHPKAGTRRRSGSLRRGEGADSGLAAPARRPGCATRAG